MILRARNESGSAMVIAIMVVLVMLALGLGTFTFVEGQQRASAQERINESSYNLAEAALESAVAYLTVSGAFPETTAAEWGGTSAAPQNGSACGPDSSTADRCPDPATVTSAYTQTGAARQPDHAGDPQWTTTMWDEGGAYANLYREGVTNASPNVMYDADADGRMWVRAEATAKSERKIIVAMVEERGSTTTASPYPASGVASSDLYVIPDTTTSRIVDMQGLGTTPGRVDLYCTNIAYPSHGQGACPGANATRGQLYPWTVSTGQPGNQCIDETGVAWDNNQYSGFHCWSDNAGADVIALRARAIAAGTYYNSSCPGNLTGEIIFIDYINGGSPCTYSGSTTWNSAADPGMIVLGQNSGITFGGNVTYHGLLYFGNSHEWIGSFRGELWIDGTAGVVGAIIIEFASIDFGGSVYIASTRAPAFTYNPAVFANFDDSTTTTTGGGGYRIVPGTYREVPLS